MISMPQIQSIRSRRRNGESIASIARSERVSEPTVRKYLRVDDLSARPPVRRRRGSVIDEWLLTEMPNAGELTDEVVDSFLPWSDRVPESCKLDPAAAEKAKEMPDDFIINIDPDAFDDEMANNAEEGL